MQMHGSNSVNLPKQDILNEALPTISVISQIGP